MWEPCSITNPTLSRKDPMKPQTCRSGQGIEGAGFLNVSRSFSYDIMSSECETSPLLLVELCRCCAALLGMCLARAYSACCDGALIKITVTVFILLMCFLLKRDKNKMDMLMVC